MTNAAEQLRLAASHRQLATRSNANGTATVTLAVTVSNTGSIATKDLRLKGPGLPVIPGENVLAVGALAAGQSATFTWPIAMLTPVAANRVRLMLIHAEGVAAGGTMPVSTGVLSRAGNNPRAKDPTTGSATEPATADAAIGGSTERVSVDSAGNQANNGGPGPFAISADGRFVAFASYADNLVPGDTNGQSDIFVHDRKTGATERVSVDSAGNQGNYDSLDPVIAPMAASSRSIRMQATWFPATPTVTLTSSFMTARPGQPSGSASTPAAIRRPTTATYPRSAPMAASSRSSPTPLT